MHERFRLTCLLALALAAGGCDGREPAPLLQPFAGDPYMGDVTVRITPPGGQPWEQSGRASARIVDGPDGRARLTVFGAIEDEKGDAGFTLDGHQDARGWRSDSDSMTLAIDPDGHISGGGTLAPQRFTFDGRIATTDFHLVANVELLARSNGNLPKGTTFEFVYDLSRATPTPTSPTAAQDAAERNDKGDKSGKCSEIRYEMRPIANIGDGTMSMLQVPICLD
ncbi:MAG: hypothetical protein L0H23_08445 [Luteimonas sp.]|nr:hypothetical protein [Luteimonas sp.]